MAQTSSPAGKNVMDGSSNSNNNTPDRDSLLYHNGRAYRVMVPGAVAGCFHLLKLGTRENYRALLDAIAHDPAMRHRLWLEALRWGGVLRCRRSRS